MVISKKFSRLSIKRINMLIQNKQLIKLIAEQCDYFDYQISDVLHALGVVLAEQVNLENEVKVKGIGNFKFKPSRPVRNYSYYSGRYMDVMSKRSVKFKPDTLFINKLNTTDAKGDNNDLNR